MARIYSASDLSTRRRELLDAAREGYAQIRDRDGTGLVMVPQQDYEQLQGLSAFLAKLIALDAVLETPLAARRAVNFGEFGWLVVFDEDDQRTFRRELLEALASSLGSKSMQSLDECLRDWKVTAAALSNEKGRRILLSKGEGAGAFKDARRPEQA